MRKLTRNETENVSGGLIIGPIVYPSGVVLAAAALAKKKSSKKSSTSESK